MLHFVWQITAIGKIDNLRSFIKHIFNVDYRNHWTSPPKSDKEASTSTSSNNQPTIHGEIFSNLSCMLRQNYPIQDQVQMNRLLKNCWFFFEISLKSLAIYMVHLKQHQQQQQQSATQTTHLDFQPNIEFYESLKSFTDLLSELLLKYASQSSLSKDNEFLAAYKCCNRSLAIFFKKSLNILNRKFLFCLINKYLESFYLNYKVNKNY